MKNRSGFTLIELLYTIFLTMMILMAGYTVFSSSNKSASLQNQLMRMQDSARMAMDVLAQHYRMTGYLLNFDNYPPSTVVDSAQGRIQHFNSATGPDSVIVTGPFSGATTTLLNTYSLVDTANTTEIVVNSTQDIKANDVIGIGFADTAVVSNVTTSGNKITVKIQRPSQTLNMTYFGGKDAFGNDWPTSPVDYRKTPTKIVRLTCRGFFIDSTDTKHPVLMQQPCDGSSNQPVAEEIEDLQIAYGVDTNKNGTIEPGEWTNTPSTAPGGGKDDWTAFIRLVRITVVARTVQQDPALIGQNRTVPALEDRPARVVNDGYHRFILTRIVKCRNLTAFRVI